MAMSQYRTQLLLVALTALMRQSLSFQPSSPAFLPTSSRLYSSAIISSDDADFSFDTGSGGVRLAQESVVKLVGSVKHKASKATADIKQLIRYTDLTKIEDSDVSSASIISTGRGKELYKEPEETEKVIELAPIEAAKDALKTAAASSSFSKIVINFAGGDDLQVLEVVEAAQDIVLGLDVAPKASVSFNSISHHSLPLEQASVTVVGLTDESSSHGLTGAQKAIANGEFYFVDGTYWTVEEEKINPAIE